MLFIGCGETCCFWSTEVSHFDLYLDSLFELDIDIDSDSDAALQFENEPI